MTTTRSNQDGAHIRDAFVHTLSMRADMLLDERTWRPCVVYLNGHYWGVYEIREKVDDTDFTDYYYDQGKYDLQFLKTWGATWSEFGGAQSQTDWDDLVAYILSNDLSIPANFDYVDSQLNWQSLCDYFMFNSYIVSQDWLNWNTGLVERNGSFGRQEKMEVYPVGYGCFIWSLHQLYWNS